MSSTPNNSPTSVWSYKPWWCQPWSIVLTGITLIGLSWLLLHRIWISTLVAIPITAWMVYFVGIYPQLVAQRGLMHMPDEE